VAAAVTCTVGLGAGAATGGSRSGEGTVARESGDPPDLSKLNRQDCQESRLETENREGPKTLGRVLDSYGLSKTVVFVMDGTVDSLQQGPEMASGYPHETLRNLVL